MGLALCGLALVVTPIGSVAAAPSQFTATQQRDLLAMTREEKLARDVYLALDERYPTMLPFGQIARSEAQHLATMRQMLDRYGIDDPTSALPKGKFGDPKVDRRYRDLLARATSATSALHVGVWIERRDMADLDAALDGLTAVDLRQAYVRLRQGSERHLSAFSR